MLTSIALVTGANKGLGKEVAQQLARRAFRVYLGSRGNHGSWTAEPAPRISRLCATPKLKENLYE